MLRPGIITPGYFSFMMAQSSTPSMPDMLMSINTTSATGLWLKGKTDMAVYLMGKATAADPYNTDNVNNYASFLTMTSAEEAALPLLQKLNRQFPRNSTILNNIGQAWFGLGDLDKAMKYLDSAVLMFAMHSRISAER
ncbi:MAG TPA: tetratricopeptide repeat protein [Chitinophagaceae bacterium]|nr:tetratricopeptide repeat protein [Chitinophagaceae bacterium]